MVSHDEEWLYLVAGTCAELPEVSDSFPVKVWKEDRIMPKNKEAMGHTANIFAPAAWIVSFKPASSNWQLVSMW